MTEKGNAPLFRERAMEQAREPEQLLDYIRVAGPGVWLELAAVIVLLAAVLLWGFTGWITDTADYIGYAENGRVTVLTADISDLSAAMPAEVNGETAAIVSLGSQPLSREELATEYSEYVLYRLAPAEWSFPILLDAPEVADGLVQVSVTLRQMRPITLLFQ